MARGSIVKRGKTYSIIYYLDGKQKWKCIGPNKKQAEIALTELMGEVHRGEYQEPKEILFKDFCVKWLEDYAEAKVRPSTYRFYADTIRLRLVPHFGNLNLTSITVHSVEQFVAKLLKAGKLSPVTVGYDLRVLKTILKRAVLWHDLKSNPAQDVQKPNATRKVMDFLTPEEVNQFLDHVSPECYPLFLCAVMTGMRRGELLGLQWGDVDWNSSRIFVRRSLWHGEPVPVKSERSIRAVVMTPKLASVLKRHKMACPPSELDLVFPNSDGKPLDADNLYHREFLRALRRAGLRKIRFHDLRHTYASLLINQGENLKFVQSQLGHASIQTTLDVYAHVLPEINAQAGERLDSTLFGDFLSKTLAKPAEKQMEISTTR